MVLEKIPTLKVGLDICIFEYIRVPRRTPKFWGPNTLLVKEHFVVSILRKKFKNSSFQGLFCFCLFLSFPDFVIVNFVINSVVIWLFWLHFGSFLNSFSGFCLQPTQFYTKTKLSRKSNKNNQVFTFLLEFELKNSYVIVDRKGPPCFLPIFLKIGYQFELALTTRSQKCTSHHKNQFRMAYHSGGFQLSLPDMTFGENVTAFSK